MTLVLKGAYRGERRLRLVRPAQRVLTCRVALHHLSMACIDVPVPGAATARIRTGIVPTRRVRDAVRYALVIPAQCDPRTNEPVVYLLPGRDGRAYAAVTELGFAGIAVELCRDGKAPYAVLAIDAGSTYFHPRSSGEDRLGVVEDDLPRLARDAAGRDPIGSAAGTVDERVRSDGFWRATGRELLAFVSAHW